MFAMGMLRVCDGCSMGILSVCYAYAMGTYRLCYGHAMGKPRAVAAPSVCTGYAGGYAMVVAIL